jgi:hypothetical protein
MNQEATQGEYNLKLFLFSDPTVPVYLVRVSWTYYCTYQWIKRQQEHNYCFFLILLYIFSTGKLNLESFMSLMAGKMAEKDTKEEILKVSC